jgi:hypothetical protein
MGDAAGGTHRDLLGTERPDVRSTVGPLSARSVGSLSATPGPPRQSAPRSVAWSSLARDTGCRVAGIVGTDEKCALL